MRAGRAPVKSFFAIIRAHPRGRIHEESSPKSHIGSGSQPGNRQPGGTSGGITCTARSTFRSPPCLETSRNWVSPRAAGSIPCWARIRRAAPTKPYDVRFGNFLLRRRGRAEHCRSEDRTGPCFDGSRAIDEAGWAEIVGSLAGDDTVFVAVGSVKESRRLADRIREFLK